MPTNALALGEEVDFEEQNTFNLAQNLIQGRTFNHLTRFFTNRMLGR
jgi:hypothetical protein